MTKEEAIKLYESGWYENKTAKELVDFQLYERRLCMPFDRYQQAVETILNRPVLTHEVMEQESLQKEYEFMKQDEDADYTSVDEENQNDSTEDLDQGLTMM